MRSHVRKSRRPRLDSESRVRLRKRVVEEPFEVLEIVSLRDVPLEERRKEAEKPLFLTRYE